MWVLLITFLIYGPETVSTNPVSMVEFASQESCEAARNAYLAEFKDTIKEVNDVMHHRFERGLGSGPVGAKLSAGPKIRLGCLGQGAVHHLDECSPDLRRILACLSVEPALGHEEFDPVSVNRQILQHDGPALLACPVTACALCSW